MECSDRRKALLEANRLLELGRMEWAQGYAAPAQAYFERALPILRAHDDRVGECRVSLSMGLAVCMLGEYSRAIDHFTECITLAQELALLKEEGLAHGNLGVALQSSGRYQAAIIHLNRAIEIHQSIGNRGAEGGHLGNLGDVYRQEGHADRAVAYHQRALALVRQIGVKRTACIELGNLGLAHHALGESEQAIAYFGEAIELARVIGEECGLGVHTGNLGDVYLGLGRLCEAEDCFEQAIRIGDELLPLVAGVFRGSLAVLRARQERFDEARALIVRGEPQVSRHIAESVKFLEKKAKVSLAAGDSAALVDIRNQMESLTAGLEFGEASEMAEALRWIRAMSVH